MTAVDPSGGHEALLDSLVANAELDQLRVDRERLLDALVGYEERDGHMAAPGFRYAEVADTRPD